MTSALVEITSKQVMTFKQQRYQYNLFESKLHSSMTPVKCSALPTSTCHIIQSRQTSNSN